MNHNAKLPSVKSALLCVALMGSFSVFAPPAMASSVQQTASAVTGVVYDELGEPVIGASVKVVGETQGVSTDFDGNFTLKISGPCKIEVSYIGYKNEIIDVKPGQNITVNLKEDSNLLDEVVVVGFGQQKKVNLTGSVGVATSKDLAGRPVQSTAAALQGVIPGLNISNSSAGGELNASKQINVRGMATIGEGSSGSPLILIDGMEGDMNALNPQDIESISVLKDAAASSIYGSRAPFGVILITTKGGSKGTTQVRYNNSFRFNQPLTPLQMMDSWEYINYLNDVQNNTSPGSQAFEQDFVAQAWAYYNGESDNFIYRNGYNGTHRRWGTGENGGTFANVDWRKELYKDTAFAQEHNLTMTGGGDKITYYVSGNFLDQGGFMKYGEDSYNRYSLMGKFNADLYSWLKIQYTSRWVRTDYDRAQWMTGGFYEKILRRLPPTNPKYDPNGYIAADYNYIEHLENGGRYIEQNDVFTNQFQVVLTPLKGWNITGEFNARINNNWTHNEVKPVYAHDANDYPQYSAENVHLAFDCGDHSNLSEYSYRSTYLNYNVFSDYMFTIADKHDLKVMLGFQAEDFKYRDLSANRDDLLVEDLPVLNLTTSTDGWGMSSQYQKWRTVGFFGRLNYDYDGRYLAEVNLRYDGTSRFRRDSRWVWSPSFSLGWNVAREEFWKNIAPYVPTLKLRGSYGQLANQNTNGWYPTYRTIGVYNQGSNWLVNGIKANTAYFPSLVTPDLTWEKIRSTNLGIDIAAFDYRLTGSFDYFWRDNHDMLGPAVTYPAVFGAGVPSENSLSLRTSGWELQLQWQDVIGQFTYSAKLNLSDDRTKITEYPNDERYISRYIAGVYTGQIYGLTTKGIAKTQEEMDAHLANVNQDELNASAWLAGDMMYEDIDGDGKIHKGNTLDNLGDLKVIGNTSPRYRFGFNLYGQWKGIDLTAFFQGVLKRDYYFDPNGGQGTWGKSAVFWGATSGGRWESLFLTPHLDYWRDESSLLGANYDAYYARPLYYTNKNREIQTKYLQNASYLRLKNLQVGYTFPSRWMDKIHVSKLRVYFSAENLCTWTKMSKVMDPESLEVSSMKSGASYPLSKTYSFGLSIDF